MFMQRHCHVVLWSQELLPGVRRGISRALDVPALLTDSFRNWFFGGTTFLGTPDERTVSLKLILFFKLRRRISSRILNHFLTPEQGLWSSWWAVYSKPCCLRSSIPFPHCHFFSQVLVLCTMEVVETNLPALIPGTAFSSDKAQEEEHLSLAAESSSVFLLSCNFTVITAVMVLLCCHCLAVRVLVRRDPVPRKGCLVTYGPSGLLEEEIYMLSLKCEKLDHKQTQSQLLHLNAIPGKLILCSSSVPCHSLHPKGCSNGL